MGLDDTKPFVNDWGTVIEKVQTAEDGTEETVTTKGIFSEPTRTIPFSGVEVISNDFTLQYPASELDLKANDRILVAGVDYAVRSEPESSDDGVFATVKLRKV